MARACGSEKENCFGVNDSWGWELGGPTCLWGWMEEMWAKVVCLEEKLGRFVGGPGLIALLGYFAWPAATGPTLT